MSNDSRFWKYLTEDSDTAYLLETTDNVYEVLENIKSLIDEYNENNIDKHQIISQIDEIRQELDKLEDNL